MQLETGEAAPANKSRNKRSGGTAGVGPGSAGADADAEGLASHRGGLPGERICTGQGEAVIGAEPGPGTAGVFGPDKTACRANGGGDGSAWDRRRTGSVRGFSVLKGRAGLPTGFPVGQRNRAAVEEAAVLFGAFSDRETHTRFFSANRPEPRRIEPFRRRVRRSLGFALRLADSRKQSRVRQRSMCACGRLCRRPGGPAVVSVGGDGPEEDWPSRPDKRQLH